MRTYTFSLDENLFKKLDNLAYKKRKNRSELLRNILKDFFKKLEKEKK